MTHTGSRRIKAAALPRARLRRDRHVEIRTGWDGTGRPKAAGTPRRTAPCEILAARIRCRRMRRSARDPSGRSRSRAPASRRMPRLCRRIVSVRSRWPTPPRLPIASARRRLPCLIERQPSASPPRKPSAPLRRRHGRSRPGRGRTRRPSEAALSRPARSAATLAATHRASRSPECGPGRQVRAVSGSGSGSGDVSRNAFQGRYGKRTAHPVPILSLRIAVSISFVIVARPVDRPARRPSIARCGPGRGNGAGTDAARRHGTSAPSTGDRRVPSARRMARRCCAATGRGRRVRRRWSRTSPSSRRARA